MLEFVGIDVGAGETLGCALCTPATPTSYYPAADLADRIIAAVSSRREAPGPNVVLKGPEPLDHPELLEVLKACMSAGAERIAVETDATAFGAGVSAVGVLRAGVRHLHVRVLDVVEERGDAPSGRPDRSRGTLAGVDAYLAAADATHVTVAVTAVVPVCRHNLIALPTTVSRLAAHGFHGVRLGCAGALPATAAAWIASACDTGMVNHLWVETDGSLPIPRTHRLHEAPGQVPDE